MCSRSRVVVLPETGLALEYESASLLCALQHSNANIRIRHPGNNSFLLLTLHEQSNGAYLPILGGDPELPVAHDISNFLATILLDTIKKSKRCLHNKVSF